MRQISRWARRHLAPTPVRARGHSAARHRVSAWAATAGLLLALGGLGASCGGDDNEGAVDGGRDGGALPQCKPADCAAIPLPVMQVCMTGTATFTCARNIDQRCTWVQPRCSGSGSNQDAQVDATADAGPGSDIGSAGDADSDAAADAGPDAAAD